MSYFYVHKNKKGDPGNIVGGFSGRWASCLLTYLLWGRMPKESGSQQMRTGCTCFWLWTSIAVPASPFVVPSVSLILPLAPALLMKRCWVVPEALWEVFQASRCYIPREQPSKCHIETPFFSLAAIRAVSCPPYSLFLFCIFYLWWLLDWCYSYQSNNMYQQVAPIEIYAKRTHARTHARTHTHTHTTQSKATQQQQQQSIINNNNKTTTTTTTKSNHLICSQQPYIRPRMYPFW